MAEKYTSASPGISNDCLLLISYIEIWNLVFCRIDCCSICSLVLMVLSIIFHLSVMQTVVSAVIPSGVCFFFIFPLFHCTSSVYQ